VQPIESVDVEIFNDTFSLSNVTDVNGYVWFNLNGTGNFTVEFSKVAYETKTIQRENLSNGTEEIYLNPQSTNGIIKLHMWDMDAHTQCIYYGINGRLKECIAYNETGYIQIYTSTNYTFRPVLKTTDLISTPANTVRYYKLWLPLMAGAFFVLCVICIFLMLIYRIVFNRRKK
jgi:hypothetical protein